MTSVRAGGPYFDFSRNLAPPKITRYTVLHSRNYAAILGAGLAVFSTLVFKFHIVDPCTFETLSLHDLVLLSLHDLCPFESLSLLDLALLNFELSSLLKPFHIFVTFSISRMQYYYFLCVYICVREKERERTRACACVSERELHCTSCKIIIIMHS